MKSFKNIINEQNENYNKNLKNLD